LQENPGGWDNPRGWIMMKKLLLLTLILLSLSLCAQVGFDRIEPPSWWIGMRNMDLQLLVHGKNISLCDVSINYPGIKVRKIHKVENPNYLFIDLSIERKAKPGKATILFGYQREIIKTVEYELDAREKGSRERKGFNPSDYIYLIMPDRFSNGDTTNDSAPGMLEKADRANPNGRHGGDLAGILNHLVYLDSLGITAIWLNPVLENNMPRYSYHGYAITDFYRIDPRLGSDEDYKKLVIACHSRGIKVIMDMVFNHCGSSHWWMQDLPTSDWIHQFPEFTRSNFRSETISDPYASDYDKSRMLTGWFDKTMPDLNQHQEFLANYLIQNSIWWIEHSGIDGIRMDTYPYSYPDFMARWMERIMEEYPEFSVVGETWLQKESTTAYWQKDAANRDGFNSQLPYVTDFPMHYAIRDAFNEQEGWTTGIARLYYILAQDFLYPDPQKTLVFADNHDLTRFFTSVGEDLDKWKMGMVFLSTTRGVPMIYYGTELLMTGEAETGHGNIRKDFPGGWPADTLNAFEPDGRTGRIRESFDYLSKLVKWRKDKPVIHSGKLKQFVPERDVYTFFRYNDSESVMVIMNNNEEERLMATDRFSECLSGYTKGKDVISGMTYDLTGSIRIPPKSALILELSK
jgi:glycosidase